MTAFHDPYRELELYLQKAQEEIGIAVKELEEHQEKAEPCEELEWSASNPKERILPPLAFRSPCDTKPLKAHHSKTCKDSNQSVNRVCYDGNLYDNEKLSSNSRSPKHFSNSGSNFFYNSSPFTKGKYGGSNYSPNTRRRLWRMHPSISFPETSKDLLMLGRSPSSSSYSTCNNFLINGDSNHSDTNDTVSKTLGHNSSYNSQSLQCRQRSHSDTSPPRFHYDVPEEYCPYPRPPSGDVNLLSIWADNLVLELDKSLSGELSESISPSSDYSLSPTKHDAPLEASNCNGIPFSMSPNDKDQSYLSTNQSLMGRGFKNASVSPDSGIEQALCETPEFLENSVDSLIVDKHDIADTRAIDCVDSAVIPRNINIQRNHNSSEFFNKSLNSFSTISNGDVRLVDGETNDPDVTFEAVSDSVPKKDKISEVPQNFVACEMEPIAPPHQFEDENSPESNSYSPINDRSRATQTEKSYCFNSVHVNKADSYSQAEASCETEEAVQDLLLPKHQLLLETLTLEENPVVVNTTCTVKAIPEIENGETAENHFQDPLTFYQPFYSLPKSKKSIPNEFDKCNTLPKDSDKHSILTQRSISQSAVSTVSYSAIDELAEFIRQMKDTSYLPPSRADASTDVKEDKDNKDAVTQTSPATLSRSSSFTWVTDYECSDLDAPNENGPSDDESLALSSCSNCKAENAGHSSSPSLAGSSEDEDSPASLNSEGSSLYLSACSGSSDSFEEAIITATDDSRETPSTSLDNDFQLLVNRRPLRASDMTLRGSTLGDITEEQITSETLSTKSNISNPSIPDSNLIDSPEESASFPSTMKLSRKCKPTGSPSQPIEPKVLIINDLNVKSISAPVLLRQKRYPINSKLSESSSSDSSPPSEARCRDTAPEQVPANANSAKEINELQAIEACSWLRAAGFPQYAQMYEDGQFPIDVSIVQKDHAFLHPDSIQSLFRRLNTLNRCAKMKFKDVRRPSVKQEESDEEEQCALSQNWHFLRGSRRWSRIPTPSDDINELTPNDQAANAEGDTNAQLTPAKKFLTPEEAYCSSHDSVFVDDQHSSPDSVRRSTLLKNEKIVATSSVHFGDCSPGSSSGSGGTLSLASEDMQQEKSRSLRRSGSDRVKEGAKALLKRMESLKGKKKKKTLEVNTVEMISAPYSGTDGSSSSSLTSSPQFRRSQKLFTSTGESAKRKNTVIYRGDNLGTQSDKECRLFLVPDQWKDSNSNDTKPSRPYISSPTSVTITSPQDEQALSPTGDAKTCDNLKLECKKNLLHPDSQSYVEYGSCDKRGSYYDNVYAPLVVFNDLYTENGSPTNTKGKAGNNQRSFDNFSQNQEDGDIIIMNKERRDSGVGSSLTRGITYQQAPWHCFPLISSQEVRSFNEPLRLTDLTAPQILLLRKLSLLKLTTIMEKFSPSSRTGWSWGVSKFIGRIRSPDYKDKVVFGVPLLLILQRTGQSLPVSIQAAIHYLRSTALDSTGLFRKSGVRSRIQKLKSLNETNTENISYEEQQAYDVADMLKQYFRELPEALLTNKLSETFIGIFQFVPEDLRLEAIHAALMLMPDENREVLQALLEFLNEISQHSGVNQMTATNLAVCFAPSLFHLTSPRSASSSPRRRKTVGVPDLRELNENKAAYECLSCMVTNYKTLFSVSEEIVTQNRLTSASFSQPATLEELCSFTSPNGQTGWKGYMESCIQMFLKETKEKYKGWKTVSQTDHVDLAYKKIVDGHPLKLWKVSTEVEAPPVELLNRIIRERKLWDSSYSKSRVVTRLEKQTDVIQYTSSSLPPHPPCDFCVLRSWRTDLPKGACILVETSIEHPDAGIPPGSVRGLILTSRYLIEPCGSGKSRITHISRVDTRGRSPEWYNRAYGHILTLLFVKLRGTFSCTRAEGPETKV